MKRARGYTRGEICVTLVTLVLIFGVLAGLGGGLFLLPLFGWIGGFWRIFAGLATEPFALLFGVAAFALCVFFLDAAVRPMLRNWSWRKSLALVSLAMGVAISGMALMCIVHCLYWLGTFEGPWFVLSDRSRAIFTRLESASNLKQIVIAAHNYEDNYGVLPVRGIPDVHGIPGQSWATHLLPYLEQTSLYEQIDFDKSWTSPENQERFKTRLKILEIPPLGTKEDRYNESGLAQCDYAMNVHLLQPGQCWSLMNLPDGAAHTIFSGEVSKLRRPWGDPANARDPALGINKAPCGFGAAYGANGANGENVSLCDGSVRFISETTDPAVLKALALPVDGSPAADSPDDFF
ncbi:MAG: DUF1559 domain-containing protein [Planctomycetia bacterium]|nr:DUF1559 domain-containing protein [Planctomycetia bacterium]